MKKKNQLIFGAFVLTAAGLFCRFAGFIYRIFLSNQLGAEGMGIYQLVFPVYGICMALCCGALQTALSRFIAGEKAGRRRTYFFCALFLSLGLALISSSVLFAFSDWIALSIIGEPRCALLLRVMARRFRSVPATLVLWAITLVSRRPMSLPSPRSLSRSCAWAQSLSSIKQQ